MSSLKCPSCGLVIFANAEKCKRCKKPLTGSKPWTPPDADAHAALPSSASDSKTILKIIPFVIFGVPLFLALKDKMFGRPVKPGGYTESLQFFVLVGCTLGLIITLIVLVLTRNK